LIDVETNATIKLDVTEDHEIVSLVFSSRNRYLAYKTRNNRLVVFDIPNQSIALQIDFEDNIADARSIFPGLAFDPSETMVVSTVSQHQVIHEHESVSSSIFNINTGQPIGQASHKGSINYVAFSQDGQSIITGGMDGFVRVLNLRQNKNMFEIEGFSPVTYVTISPLSGKFIAAGFSDGSVVVWNLMVGNEVSRIKHDRPITSISFSNDDRFVVSSSWDGSVKVWRTLNGAEITAFRFSRFPLEAKFSNDDLRIFSMDYEKIYVWYFHADDLIRVTCTRLPRNFTRYEWSLFFPNEEYRETCPSQPPEK
jgi:WD40 repeat protein